MESARKKSSRIVTQLILNLVDGSPIVLVDGGNQRRCFTDYGDGYQDIAHRKPRIDRARTLLHWQPTISFSESLDKTLDYFLQQAAETSHTCRR